MPPLSPKHLKILLVVSIPLLFAASYLLGIKDNFRVASIAAGSCYFQSEIDSKIAERASLGIDLTASKNVRAGFDLDAQRMRQELSSTIAAIPAAEKVVVSDYAMSLEKKKVDDFFDRYNAEKVIYDTNTEVKNQTAIKTSIASQLPARKSLESLLLATDKAKVAMDKAKATLDTTTVAKTSTTYKTYLSRYNTALKTYNTAKAKSDTALNNYVKKYPNNNTKSSVELSSDISYATSQISTLTKHYNSLVAAYKSRFRSNPGNWPMTERSYRVLKEGYDTLLIKNNTAKDALQILLDTKVSLEAAIAELPQKIIDTDNQIAKLSSSIEALDLVISQAVLCGSNEIMCLNTTSEGVPIDDDRDGKANCDDSDCAYTEDCGYTPPVHEYGGEICDNGIDDDLNGQVDCDDGNCGGAPYCNIESCNNFYDDNGDGLADCEDPTCFADTACMDQSMYGGDDYGGGAEMCGDGADNDNNGFTDCEDPACSTLKECTGEEESEVCGDGMDNNGDGVIDENCSSEEVCNNNIDDNGDGQVDENCCPDDNEDGLNDETGEACGEEETGGCSDSDAMNFDPNAATDKDREETCEYEFESHVTIVASDKSGYLASAISAIKRFLAGDPDTVEGFVGFIRLTLRKTETGKTTLTFSGQVAPETASGAQPIGAIQTMPTITFSGGRIVRTPPYWSDDDIQRYIHQQLDSGFVGDSTAKMHKILQQTMDIGWQLRRDLPR